MAGLSPQPQTRAGEAAKDESSTGEGEPPAAEADPDGIAAILARPPIARCKGPDCGLPLIRPDRDLCHGCEAYLNEHGRDSA